MLTLLALPDHAIDFILSKLNQKCKLSVMLMNKELYKLTVKSLYQQIYLNTRKALFTNTYTCNHFNCIYTIISSKEKLYGLFQQRQELLRLVKLIMFETFNDFNLFKEINSKDQYSWIRVGWVDGGYLDDLSDIDIVKEMVYPFNDLRFIPESVNYTITKLTIILDTEIDQFDFKSISYMKALKHVCFCKVSGNNMRKLRWKFKPLLCIECLSLSLEWDRIKLGHIIDVVNLSKVTSLKLEIRKGRDDNMATSKLEFQWLLNNLPNLKNLFIETRESDWISTIVGLAKENSLKTLTVGHIPDSDFGTTIMKEVFDKQQQSIQKLSCHFLVNSSITVDVFDKIYKCKMVNKDRYETIIAEFLGNNPEKYPHLNYIVMGYLHYEISRIETGFRINPVNY